VVVGEISVGKDERGTGVFQAGEPATTINSSSSFKASNGLGVTTLMEVKAKIKHTRKLFIWNRLINGRVERSGLVYYVDERFFMRNERFVIIHVTQM
jgi:hypothetical protein